jgi:hypothetical protein
VSLWYFWHEFTDGDCVELALNDDNAVLATINVNYLIQLNVLNGQGFVLLVFLTNSQAIRDPKE